MKKTPEMKNLDSDWIELLKQAKSLGLDIDEVREFLCQSTQKKKIM